jgi:hypothetical protein
MHRPSSYPVSPLGDVVASPRYWSPFEAPPWFEASSCRMAQMLLMSLNILRTSSTFFAFAPLTTR